MLAIKGIYDNGKIELSGNGNRKMTHRGNPNLTRPLVKKSIPILLFTAERIPK